MKKSTILCMTALMVVSVLTGCRSNIPQDTTGNIVPSTTNPTTTQTPTTTVPPTTQNGGNETSSQSVQILNRIWEQYGEAERFACYGGTVEQATSDAPGPLDLTNTDELTAAYLIPQDQLSAITEAASLVHMMNSNIFTGAAVKVSDSADQKALQQAWRDTIQGNRWICGQPDRLMMAVAEEGYLVMAFGSTDAMKLFSDNLKVVYPEAQIVYDEAIVS